jgi:hypothetical protein
MLFAEHEYTLWLGVRPGITVAKVSDQLAVKIDSDWLGNEGSLIWASFGASATNRPPHS